MIYHLSTKHDNNMSFKFSFPKIKKMFYFKYLISYKLKRNILWEIYSFQ